jgi:hypothetical protein
VSSRSKKIIEGGVGDFTSCDGVFTERFSDKGMQDFRNGAEK